MPMGAGGLMRYPEEEKEVIKLKPKHIIWIVIGIREIFYLVESIPVIGFHPSHMIYEPLPHKHKYCLAPVLHAVVIVIVIRYYLI